MSTRSCYKTKQKDLILAYLAGKKNQYVSVDMIAECLKGKVGITTIYRYLDKLIKEGVVLKHAISDSKNAYYQYLEPSENSLNQYNLLCVECGQILHLGCNYLDELSIYVQKELSFKIDNHKTIFNGYCENCIDEKQ